MDIRVPKILAKLHADEDTILIIQSSTNDITNLRKLSGRDKEAMEAMAEKSARQMVTIAKKAIMDFDLKQVIILAKPRRADDAKLEHISEMSNSQLIALEAPNAKLAFQENSAMYKLSEGALFGYKNFDGIHLNSGV